MSIFVQIAGYRDPLLAPTIKDLFEKAGDASGLRLVVCNQFHPNDAFNAELDAFRNHPRIIFIDVPYNESKGVCWARNRIQQYYEGEEYTFQVDSHMRFKQGWDQLLTGIHQSLEQDGVAKPLLTTYPPNFDPDSTEVPDAPPNRIKIIGFHREGIPFCWPDIIPGWEQLSKPVPGRFYAAGFSFARGAFCQEVPHDPGLYFGGEEINIALRAYTHGYDIYYPHINIAWHYYSRDKRNTHWDDRAPGFVDRQNAKTLYRLKRLFDRNDHEAHREWGKYGLGTKRSLSDYEHFAGVLLLQQKMQEFTFRNILPPNPNIYRTEEEWQSSFFYHFRETIKIPRAVLNEKENNLAILSFFSNFILLREVYFNREHLDELAATEEGNFDIEALLPAMPDSWVLAVHHTQNEWAKVYKGNTSYLLKNISPFSANYCMVL